jgi:glutamine cyclotransferase
VSSRFRAGLGGLLLLCALGAGAAPATPVIPYKVIAHYDHRSGAFTPGLERVGDTLYESSGLYRQSYIARWQLQQQEPVFKQPLPAALFGEGLTVLGERLYMLTWRAGRGLVFDRRTLRPLAQFRYAGEGWGLTHNGRQLIMSDGSATLRFLDPATARVERSVAVTERGRALDRLNELEWVGGRVLANVWQTDTIAVIDPDSGAVTARLDSASSTRRAGARRAPMCSTASRSTPATARCW